MTIGRSAWPADDAQWRKDRDARAFKLASTHEYVQSIATTNVCGECGAHKSYHDETLRRLVRRGPTGPQTRARGDIKA